MVLGQERTIRRLLIVLQYTIVAYTNGGGVKRWISFWIYFERDLTKIFDGLIVRCERREGKDH